MGTNVMLQPRKLTRTYGPLPIHRDGTVYHKIISGMPYYRGGVPYNQGHVVAKMFGWEWMPLPQMDKLLSDDRYRNKITPPLAVASFLAYPPANHAFETAKGVMDSKTGCSIDEKVVAQLDETEKAAGRDGVLGVKGIAIYASSENVRRVDKKTVIDMPETIGVIYNLVCEQWKYAKANTFGINVEVRLPISDGVTVGPLVLDSEILRSGEYHLEVSVASNPDDLYTLPFMVSLDKLLAEGAKVGLGKLLAEAGMVGQGKRGDQKAKSDKDEFLKHLEDNSTETEGGLMIVSQDASKEIVGRLLYLTKKAD